MLADDVLKYRLPVRVLHWIHTGAFTVLFITGLLMYIRRLTFHALENITHIIHLTAAGIFILVPVIYLIIFPAAAFRGLKIAFSWGMDDFKWFAAVPRYYFSNKKGMPPQGFLSAGQKVWWLVTIFSFLTFAITGLTMWFFIKSAPVSALNHMIMVHDIAFAVTGFMFLVHIYLGLFNPKHTESLKAMTKGKISVDYAREFHGKWYAEKSREKEKEDKIPLSPP